MRLMQPILLFQLLVLVAVANGAALVAKKVLGEAFASPLDGGAVFIDGQPLLGPSKTIRGILVSLVATPIAAALMGLGWEVGAVVAIAAMAGDLLSSFVKRRLGLAPSSMAIGLDQIPESLIPLAASRLLLPVSLLDIAAGTAIFFVGELALSRILFKLRVRDRPY
jgi:CDP-archaeol synthase